MSVENQISLALIIINGAGLAILGAPDGVFPPLAKPLALVMAGMTTPALAFLRSIAPSPRVK